MIPVDDALGIVTAAVKPLPPEEVPLGFALGRVLAEPVHSETALPPFDQSAVDGYAVRHRDIASVPVTLPVKGVVAARGHDTRPVLDYGTMMRIFTGGVVPDGADTIVRQEATEPGGDERWTVTQAIAIGTDLRRAGEELPLGGLIAEPGTIVTPGVIGAVATGGVARLKVHSLPRVDIKVTGDEVVGLGEPLRIGQVRDSNGRYLESQFMAWSIPFHSGHVSDDEVSLRASLDKSFSDSSLIITTGGVSVGDFDFIPKVARDLGAEVLLHKVAQKPGMPLFVAKRGECLLLGLPGNPGAVFVNMHVYARAVLDVMSGLDLRARWRRAPMPEGVRREAGKTFWLRARAVSDDAGRVRLEQLGHQASHMLSNLTDANALVRIPPEGEAAETVEWLPL